MSDFEAVFTFLREWYGFSADQAFDLALRLTA